MKRFVLLIFILTLGGFCRADNSNTVAGFVYQTAVSSGSTLVITVSTFGATQMDNPQLAGRAAMEIQNIDSTASLWCTAVSSYTPTVVSSGNGRKISSGASWYPNFLSSISYVNYSTTTGNTTTYTTAAKIWCISDGAAATKSAVTQAY